MVSPFGNEEKPVKASSPRALDRIERDIALLLMHVNQVCYRCRFSKVEPSGVVLIETKVGTEEEEGCDDRPDGRVIDVVIAFANSKCFLEEDVAEWHT